MKESNSLALIVSYFLSRFDRSAYESLGYSSSAEAHREVGRILGVNPNSVKNMRDEFDPLHDNARVGWYQRPLRPSRAKVVETFQDMGEDELRDVVLEILTNPEFQSSSEFNDIVGPISQRQKLRKAKGVYAARGPTGRKAEEAFQSYYSRTQDPVPGLLYDERDLGSGFDFSIEGTPNVVEVKGLEGAHGGIGFTSKEWRVAKEKGDTYFLAVVRNTSTVPTIQLIRNPAAVLPAKKTIFSIAQVTWLVGDKALSSSKDLDPAGSGA